jgi:hypothetical protein
VYNIGIVFVYQLKTPFMKHLQLPFLVVILAAILSSCRGRLDCDTTSPPPLQIEDYDSTVFTWVTVITYKVEKGKTVQTDSTQTRIKNKEFYYKFAEDRKYIITLFPQNRQHTISDVHHGNEYKLHAHSGLSSEHCSESISLKLDGNPVIKNAYNVDGHSGGMVGKTSI